MRNLILLSSLFIIVLFLYACPEKTGQNIIYVNNKSDNKIAFQIGINKQDTTFYCSDVGKTILFMVEKNSMFNLENPDYYSTWSSYLKLLTIYILDGELYDKYWQQPCDSIRKYVPVLHRYQLTLEDLQRMNWTVVYPPEE
jgi:hypothetical protein